MSREPIEHTFEVKGAPTVRVKNINGRVTVQPGGSGEVVIRAVVHGGADGPTRVEIGQEEDGTIYARTNHDRKASLFGAILGNARKVDYTITVPAQANLSVDVVNCDVDVQGVDGEVNLETVNGRIHAEDVSGDLEIKTVNGRVEGSRISGPLRVRTINGRILVTESDLPTLSATTVNGGMELDTPMGEGPYNLKTVSGTVRLYAENRAPGKVLFKSVAGRVRVSDQAVRGSRRKFQGGRRCQAFELSEDGPEIHFNSVSGGLRIISDEETDRDEVPAEERQAEPSSPAFMNVLEQISTGEMSVEDALRSLENG